MAAGQRVRRETERRWGPQQQRARQQKGAALIVVLLVFFAAAGLDVGIGGPTGLVHTILVLFPLRRIYPLLGAMLRTLHEAALAARTLGRPQL